MLAGAFLLCAFAAGNDVGTLRIASLHPLLSDMARRLGGEQVEVVDLFPATGDLHEFSPTGESVASAAGSRLLLACGKGVEPYLDSLRQAMGSGVRVVELGADIPDVMVPDSNVPDPHWWNSPANMKRASIVLADALKTLLPQDVAEIERRQADYAQSMDALSRAAALRLSRIPLSKRTLVTSHAAMCHFCAEFRMRPLAAQGVARESGGDTARVAQLLKELRAAGVPTLFAEWREAPQYLEHLAEQVGARVERICMDGVALGIPDYEGMFLRNLQTICNGLAGYGTDERNERAQSK